MSQLHSSIAQTMKPLVLDRDFFARPAIRVARELIGKYLVRRIGNRRCSRSRRRGQLYVQRVGIITGGATFLHAYGETFEDQFFFEVVQRDQYDGYGALNAPARLASSSL